MYYWMQQFGLMTWGRFLHKPVCTFKVITLTHLAILEELNKLILRCALKNSVFGLETISISKEKVGGRLKKIKTKKPYVLGILNSLSNQNNIRLLAKQNKSIGWQIYIQYRKKLTSKDPRKHKIDRIFLYKEFFLIWPEEKSANWTLTVLRALPWLTAYCSSREPVFIEPILSAHKALNCSFWGSITLSWSPWIPSHMCIYPDTYS